MKKLVLGLLTACLFTGLSTSCNGKLDVQPVDSIDAASALNTNDDVVAALVGTYTSLQNNSSYNGYIPFLSDVLANDGDFEFVGTFVPPQEVQRKSIRKDNGFVETIWARAYVTINRSNNVLANLGKLNSAANKTRVEGEARFLRALNYFDLVRLYGRAWNDGTPSSNPGVPLVLTPTTIVTDANNVKRNTVAEVYSQVIADLNAAEANLPASNGFFANKYAAAALLSRVYLQQGRFAEAADAANRVITGNAFSLTLNYADEFFQGGDLLSNTSEDIFAVQNSAQSSIATASNQLNTFYSQFQRGDVSINDQLLNQFEMGDARADLFTATASQTYSDKYNALYGNVKVIRLAETYLTRAEGNFRAGTNVGSTPLADINRIRTRVGLSSLTVVSLPDILKERKLELAFEGFRLHDLKRNKESTIDPASNAPIAWNSSRLVFPIPQREINANPNLTQNAGY